MKQLLFKNGNFSYQDYNEKISDLLEVDCLTSAASLECMGDKIYILCDDEFLLKRTSNIRFGLEYQSYGGHVEVLLDNVIFQCRDENNEDIDLSPEDAKKIIANVKTFVTIL